MALYYIESSTGTIHLTDHEAYGSARSFCGQVTGHAAQPTNEWKAHQLVAGDRGGVNINPNLCQRCLKAAQNQEPGDYRRWLEMADEHETKKAMKRERSNARRNRGHRPLEDDL